MELIVFDLDGTLLNKESAISDYTRATLRLLAEREVAYTVATGRTLHAAREILSGHQFTLPHVYKNGVLIWHPDSERFSHRNVLTEAELRHVVDAVIEQGITPFVFTLEGEDGHAIYHSPLRNETEQRLATDYAYRPGIEVGTLDKLPADAQITNVSAIGPRSAIRRIVSIVEPDAHLVAYSGVAIERHDLLWLDIHHSDASKGGAIQILKEMLGVERVICFGDSENDLSMFELADESYAPANARDDVKAAATAVVGHHDEEGIARFLRERFGLAG